jgi:hypothetical protein
MSIHRPKRVTYRTSRDSASASDSSKEAKAPEWAEAVEGKGPKDFKPYAVSSSYAPGDLVRHAKFGHGVVLSAESNKMEVLFESGPRKLAHALGG